MGEVRQLRRRATIHDYKWNNTLEKYVLTFNDELVPGVIASSPEEGVKLYNEYLDSLGKPNTQFDKRSEQIKNIYNFCIASENIGTVAASVYTSIFLNHLSLRFTYHFSTSLLLF